MTKYTASLGYKTLWQGDVFRSILESEWAKFLSMAGLPYIYEGMSVKINGHDDRKIYTPDFLIRGIESEHTLGYNDNYFLALEAKPSGFSFESEEGKIVIDGLSRIAFLFRGMCTCCVLIGRPNDYECIEVGEFSDLVPSHFWQCPICAGIEVVSDKHEKNHNPHIEWKMNFHGPEDERLWQSLKGEDSATTLRDALEMAKDAANGNVDALTFLEQLERVVYE